MVEKQKEARAPDKEKLINWAHSILEISSPILLSESARKIASDALSEIYMQARKIITEVEDL